MKALRRFVRRLTASVLGRLDDDRIREELAEHLALLTEDHVRAGLPLDEARRQARLKLGAVEAVAEAYQDVQRLRVLESVLRDARYALRQLRRTPSFTLTVSLTLALGIGVTTAIFSLFHHALLRPLPVVDPHRLVNLSSTEPRSGSHVGDLAAGRIGSQAAFSYPMFRDLERLQTAFTGIAAHKGFEANLSFDGKTTSGSGLAVSGSYFPVLGVQPGLGRLIAPADDRAAGEPDIVVLSDAYWRRHLESRPDVLGETLAVNGRRMTIVGVTPSGFDGTTLGRRPEVYVPITMYGHMNRDWNGFENRRSYWALLFARLRPGVTLEQARTSTAATFRALVADTEAALHAGLSGDALAQHRTASLVLERGPYGQSALREVVWTPLVLLLAVSGAVLVIACVNVANMLLARATTRVTEMTVRASLGASRGRLLVQLLTESCLLAGLGGTLGLGVALLTLRTFLLLVPDGPFGTAAPVTLGTAALSSSGIVTLATGVLFGLIPAIQVGRVDLASAMRSRPGQPAGRRAAGVRTALATAQIALSMMLLVLAGLFAKSLVQVSRVDIGMAREHLLTFSVAPELNGYTPERATLFYERLVDELAAQPGVTGVTGSFVPAVAGDNRGKRVRLEGVNEVSASQYNEIGPGYFTTMGISLIAGRQITRADTSNAPRVAVVNEAFAKKFGLDDNIVGMRMTWCCAQGRRSMDGLDTEIVGLVKDARYSMIKQATPPVFYIPYRQTADRGLNNIYVRSASDPRQLMPLVRHAVGRLDPNLPIDNLKTMGQQARENVFVDWLIGMLSSGFAVLATLLATIGLYGVLAYTVAQRTAEIGLRMALGATPHQIRSVVLRRVAGMVAAGVLCGVAGALAAGRAARALLFEVQTHDPLVLAGSALVVTVVALGAGGIPAFMASRVDPMQALRPE
jgi:predicted permease